VRPSAPSDLSDFLREERRTVAQDLQPGAAVYRRIGRRQPLNRLPHRLVMVIGEKSHRIEWNKLATSHAASPAMYLGIGISPFFSSRFSVANCAGFGSRASGGTEAAGRFCHTGCLSDDALEHRGEGLTPVDRRVVRPFEDRANLIPDGFPLGTLTIQIEFGQDAFEPVDQFGMALKPWIGTTLVKKGLDLVHRALPIAVLMPHHRWAVRVLDLQTMR
jgi:hypothetical protein